MRQATELSKKILTDNVAKRIIDWISPVYGDSYVGLWALQAIGSALTVPEGIAESLRQEVTAATTVSLIGLWEEHYGIPDGTGMTIEERRARILQRIALYGAVNPAKLEAAVSNALGGAATRIIEHTGDHRFNVRVDPTVTDYREAKKILDKLKPAHLRYDIGPDYNRHIDIKTSGRTHGELEAYTHTEIQTDPDVVR